MTKRQQKCLLPTPTAQTTPTPTLTPATQSFLSSTRIRGAGSADTIARSVRSAKRRVHIPALPTDANRRKSPRLVARPTAASVRKEANSTAPLIHTTKRGSVSSSTVGSRSMPLPGSDRTSLRLSSRSRVAIPKCLPAILLACSQGMTMVVQYPGGYLQSS